jgi:O-antigen ligase
VDSNSPLTNPGTTRLSSLKTLTGGLFALHAHDVQLYRVCDDLSGVLIFSMLVFSPWAFGTTQPWSIWMMNVAGYILGVLLLAKLWVREVKGYPAPRWENFSKHSGTALRRRHRSTKFLIRTLAILTLAVLAYCLTTALNAAATYDSNTRLFDYHHYLGWLPHSFDSHRTWFYFGMYFGLAGSFWAVWDWLLGMTTNEGRATRLGAGSEIGKSLLFLPLRLRWLLWIICVNGTLVGIEAIVQRVSNSNKLLFLVQPLVNWQGETQFGPYAYRSNAAQFFNLIWPLCLALWWTLHRATGFRAGRHHILLGCATIVAACPIISTSRGGALVAVGCLILAMVLLIAANIYTRGQSGCSTLVVLVLFFSAVISLGWVLGWKLLEPRMEQIGEGYQNREEIYDSACSMATDYPLFGTGPGTFATVFQLYRISNSTYWPEQLHNDWLETRITFGWFGLILLLMALGCIVFRWFAPGGIRASKWFVLLAWLGPLGCLVHACFDFPFQIYSILFLFLVICAALFAMTRRIRG